jgi:Spy/CpxP family protein refolding chaperone
MRKTILAVTCGTLALACSFMAQAGCKGPGPGPFGTGPMPTAPCLSGQWGPGSACPRGGIDAHLARLTARLGLNPEQRAEIRDILEVQRATLQAIDKALDEAMREQVDNVLTPEQRARHARMHAWRDRTWGGVGPAPVPAMTPTQAPTQAPAQAPATAQASAQIQASAPAQVPAQVSAPPTAPAATPPDQPPAPVSLTPSGQ